MKSFHILGGVLLLSSIAVSANANSKETSTTEHFIKNSLASHPLILSAKSNLAATQAEAEAKKQPLYNPELEVELERTTENTSIFGLSQSFDWSGKTDVLEKIGQQALLKSNAQLKETEFNLQIDLLRQLAKFNYDKKQNELASRSKRLMEEFYVIAQSRHEVGEISQVDVDLVELARLGVMMQANEIQAAYLASQQLLSYYISSPATSWPEIAPTLPAVPVVDDMNKLLRQHPKMKKLEANVQARKAEVQLSERQQQADPNFGIKAGLSDGEDYIGLSFSIPLNIRNSYKSETKAARARVTEAEIMLDENIRQSTSAIKSTLTRYQANYQAWQDWQQAGSSILERRIKNLDAIWKSGELATSDYLLQLRESLNANEMKLKAEYQAWSSWFDWLTLSGTLTLS